MYRSARPSALRQRIDDSSRSAKKQKNKRVRASMLLLLSAGLIVVISTAVALHGYRNHTPAATGTKSNAADNHSASSAGSPPSGQTSGTQYSLTDPKSIWIVVNKQRPLNPKTYAPSDLVVPSVPLRSNITSTEKYVRADMAKALEKMVGDAAKQDVHLNLQSGYRSYNFQVTLYNGYVQSQGKAEADRQSARPGYSEHQTGLAADLGGTSQPSCNVAACFADTTEGKWLAANAYKYGFIIRYASNKEPVTGYLYEPWHIRYIGTDLSTKMHADSIETLEEFFGLGAAPNY